jgi:hypothetical protein
MTMARGPRPPTEQTWAEMMMRHEQFDALKQRRDERWE